MMKQRHEEEMKEKCVKDTLLKGPECETIWMPIIYEYVYMLAYIFFGLII